MGAGLMAKSTAKKATKKKATRKKTKKKVGRGRPTTYNAKVASQICEQLAEGMTLRAICRQPGMPAESTVRQWASHDREGFYAHYARARDIGLDAMADELMDICDNASNDWMEREGENSQGWILNGEHVNRSRLRVDTRKWYLSKLAPKRYGDRKHLEHTGKDGEPLNTQTVVVLPAKDGGS